MWMVAAYQLTSSASRLGLRVGGHLALSLHSSYELGELLSGFGHHDSTTNRRFFLPSQGPLVTLSPVVDLHIFRIFLTALEVLPTEYERPWQVASDTEC